jgi:hypothetical protein
MICAGTKDNAKYVVVVCFCVFEPLDHDRPNAIGTTIAVGCGIPSLAGIMSSSEEMAFAQTCETIRVRQDVHTTSDGHVDLPIPQRLAG